MNPVKTSVSTLMVLSCASAPTSVELNPMDPDALVCIAWSTIIILEMVILL